MKTAGRFLIALALLAAVAAGLVASFYVEENWRGARQWAATQRELQARGAFFDRFHFVPPPVPDDQNLALAPVFARLYEYRVDPATGLLTFNREGNEHASQTVDTIPFGDRGGPVSGGPGWEAGQNLQLEKFQEYYRHRDDFPRASTPQSPAADVLLALTRFDPLLTELAQAAASRPQAQFPVNYTQEPPAAILLPHYNLVQKLVSLLRQHACAELALDKPDGALRDVLLGLRLRGAIAPEPTLVATLVSVTCGGLLMQPIWESLHDRRWSAVQLAELQRILGAADLLAEYRRTVEAERAFAVLPLADYLRDAKDLNRIFDALTLSDRQPPVPHWLSTLNRLFPRGWYNEAKAVASRLDQQYTIDPVDVLHHRVDAGQIAAGNALLYRLPIRPSTVVAKLSLPVYHTTALKVARVQTMVDQAMIACALERYFLDHQSYPASLGELAPTYLAHIPTDLIDGQPVRYQLAPSGRYRLWTVGWNGTDEGGAVVYQKGTARPDLEQGDWVWQYEPAKQ